LHGRAPRPSHPPRGAPCSKAVSVPRLTAAFPARAGATFPAVDPRALPLAARAGRSGDRVVLSGPHSACTRTPRTRHRVDRSVRTLEIEAALLEQEHVRLFRAGGEAPIDLRGARQDAVAASLEPRTTVSQVASSRSPAVLADDRPPVGV